MRVLVTRPASQASEWVDKLRAAGLDAVALPLIVIAPPADIAEVQSAWHGLAAQALVMFVSPNAVAQFFALQPAGVAWPDGVTAASPGPGTTQTLLHHGVPSACIVEPAADAPQFDSEALWQVLATRDWRGRHVLIVRGTSGRDWLAERLCEHGAQVGSVATYRRLAPQLDETQRQCLQQALANPQQSLWFFSSSEAIDHLQDLAPEADWSAAQALATHPRIAERARALGIAHVHEARPALEAAMACIQSIAS
jgi:uroporphyrinogen-III synthase